MVDQFRLIRKILPRSNGCKLAENGYRFVNQRKCLCFGLFMKQRKFFCSIKRTFSPEQTQNAPKQDINLRLFCFLSVWNCSKSIFGQIPEIHKKTKRNNYRYPGDGTSHFKPIFSSNRLHSHNTMWSHP